MSYLGENIPKLGFGLMRLPRKNDEIDIEQTKEMVDAFLDAGFTYFDTAYAYPGSEVAAKVALVDRHPRDSFQLATKCPLWETDGPDYFDRIFQESRRRAGVEYFDFYLLHMIGEVCYDLVKDNGGFEYIQQLKEKGLAKHIGFSTHDDPAFIEKMLINHPYMEFVQIQLNYIDWESDDVRARACYEMCKKYDKPVIVMEPVKGGSLAGMRPEAEAIFKKANPEASVASWALRYAASTPGLVTVLSGMSNVEQMQDNLKTMKNFQPLTDKERDVIAEVVDVLHAVPTIPCTGCRYCVEGCPQNIAIPQLFNAFNKYKIFENLNDLKGANGFITRESGAAADCLQCGACEAHCPQHINIIEQLAELAKLVE